MPLLSIKKIIIIIYISLIENHSLRKYTITKGLFDCGEKWGMENKEKKI